jgi:hypothetical protein
MVPHGLSWDPSRLYPPTRNKGGHQAGGGVAESDSEHFGGVAKPVGDENDELGMPDRPVEVGAYIGRLEPSDEETNRARLGMNMHDDDECDDEDDEENEDKIDSSMAGVSGQSSLGQAGGHGTVDEYSAHDEVPGQSQHGRWVWVPHVGSDYKGEQAVTPPPKPIGYMGK